MFRSGAVCLGAALAGLWLFACGGSGSRPAPPDSGTPPTFAPPDAGLPDAGLPDAGAPDGGEPGGTGGGGGSGEQDGGTALADCKGLVPSAGDPILIQSAHDYDGPQNQCLAGTSDGHGDVVLGGVLPYQMGATTLRFYAPDGTYRTSQGGSGIDPLPQADGFLGIEPFNSEYVIVAYSGAGAQTRNDDVQNENTLGATRDPLGGMVFFEGSPADASGAGVVVATDASGAARWRTPLTGPGDAVVATLGVDRAGNVLVVYGHFRESPVRLEAIWLGHEGAVRSGYFPFASGQLELVPRLGSGFFLRRVGGGPMTAWFGEIDAGSTDVQDPPIWLSTRPGTHLHPVHGGRGYALMPDPSTTATAPCEQSIEVLSPRGESCGTVRLRFNGGSCTPGALTIGYDGTTIQRMPRELSTCGGAYCNCAWRLWPHLFG